MKKKIIFDRRAWKEWEHLDILIRAEFSGSFKILEENGELFEPDAKKLSKNLYEVRIRIKSSWRAFYAYLEKDRIMILHIFQKKSKKTPKKEIMTALNRLRLY